MKVILELVISDFQPISRDFWPCPILPNVRHIWPCQICQSPAWPSPIVLLSNIYLTPCPISPLVDIYGSAQCQDNATITPLISSTSADFIESLAKDAEAKGAKLWQAWRREGNLIWPVLIDNVTKVHPVNPVEEL